MFLNKIKNFLSPVARKRATGKVKYFNRRKGYGFIETKEVDPDIFVHVTDLEDFVSRGDHVEFKITKSDKGYEAKNVKLVHN
ncbi:MAG: cold shock domain-containing protein [Saprospiraceae bacterium]|nr:cold shock domain-containing protein [Saprospiraceae bacterium]